MQEKFTPALGFASLTPFYDLAIGLMTRERRWRSALLRQMSPLDGQTILDVGCGTGTLAILIKKLVPSARMVGLDPDASILKTAAAKAQRAGVAIEWRQGFARDAATFEGQFDQAVSTLLFHQVSMAEKVAGIGAMVRAVRPGGEVHIADYSRQREWLMRQLFRVVQALDGRANTQANVEGAVEEILTEWHGAQVAPSSVVRTPTGSISLYRIRRNETGQPTQGAPGTGSRRIVYHRACSSTDWRL